MDSARLASVLKDLSLQPARSEDVIQCSSDGQRACRMPSAGLLIAASEPLIEGDTATIAVLERAPMPPGSRAPGVVTGATVIFTLARTTEGWHLVHRYAQTEE